MDALQILEQLEAVSGTNEKIAILKANRDNRELVELLDAALNFKRKFYVKKFNVPNTHCISPNTINHDMFMGLLDNLEHRYITGNNAIAAVEEKLKYTTSLQLKWYPRIIRKDLRCNFGISSCVKAGINIPEFDVMLAKDGKEVKNLREIISKGVYLSPKFDGYRCLAVCNNGDVTLYSRNGSEYENFPSIIESLSKASANTVFVLDGEIMSDDFNKMQQSAFASVRGTTVGDVKYHVFGMIPYDEWVSGNFVMPTNLRLKSLDFLFSNNEIMKQASNLVQVKHKLVHTVEDVLLFEQDCLARGYEGAMALPNIPYYLGKKSNRLMKFKTMLSQDCKVVGMYEGLGKHEGTLGGLSVIQENGNKCDVGSGFTDGEREFIWNNQHTVIGRTAEIKYQELTPDGIMRFPVFIRWRNDK